jgi:bifunctional ADP-heptose synthase (sugar kinase/adenylyltransferase)
VADILPASRLVDLLTAIRTLRVGVVGDFTLTGRWVSDMTRSQLSLETPLFPRPVIEEHYACGGAASAALNLAALGVAEVRAFTIFGADWRSALLRVSLSQAGVSGQDSFIDPAWNTPLLGKVILRAGSKQQEDAPLHFINTTLLSVESEVQLLARLEAALPHLDGLVIADNQPVGVITPRVLDGLNELAARFPQTLFAVDSRERVGRFQGMVRMPNQDEAARWLFPERAPEFVRLEELAEAGLHPQVDCACPLLVTLGAQGSLVLAGGESHLVPAVPVPPPDHSVGPGDTFLAALAAGLAAGAHPLEAAQLAHLATAVAQKKSGFSTTASGEEIIELARNIV